MYQDRRKTLTLMINDTTKWFIIKVINLIKIFLITIVGLHGMAHSEEHDSLTNIMRPTTPDPRKINKYYVWKMDQEHSSIVYYVEYMKISKIWGRFDSFDATLILDAKEKAINFNSATIELKIDANSINTQNSDRDTHLKSRDFLSVDIHPNINLDGTLYQTKKENVYDMVGIFYMNGVERKIKLKVKHMGTMTNIDNEIISMFQIKGKINRKHHNIIWNKILDNGGILIGDVINFEANIQMVKQPSYN